MGKWTEKILLLVLNYLKDGDATGTPLVDAEVGLFINDLADPIDPTTIVIGDLTEPAWAGYARQAIAAWVNGVDANGIPILTHVTEIFQPTDAVGLPQQIYGLFLVDDAGDLVAVQRFDEPRALVHVGQPVMAQLILPMSPDLPDAEALDV